MKCNVPANQYLIIEDLSLSADNVLASGG